MSKTIIAVTVLSVALGSTSAWATVGCPTDRQLSSVDVIGGNYTPPFRIDPDQVQGTEQAPTSETWTKLSLQPQPITLACRYADGSQATYSVPNVDTCTFYSQPTKALVCQ